MKIHVLPAGPLQTNAYLLTAAERGEAVLVDAPAGVWADVAKVLKEEKCSLRALWLTHGHFDHIQGVDEVVRGAGVKVYGHEADRVMMATPALVEARLGFSVGPLLPVHPDVWWKPPERVAVLGGEAEVRYVPGHCPGSVLFYFAHESVVFVGDAIFAGSIGRTDFEGGSFEMLERSVREQVYTLPDETIVYPGHGPATTVGKEKRSNPYIRP